MAHLLIKSKRIRLNVPIPPNSSIAVTDIFFENRDYNIINGDLVIAIHSDQQSMSNLFKTYTQNGYWHVVNLKLTPGYYSNLKQFLKECLSAAVKLQTFAERRIVGHLFSRFQDEGGRLKILPSSEGGLFTNFLFKINFLGEKISEYLGLHTNQLLIDDMGMAEDMVWAPYLRPYIGPQLKLINFESRSHFSIQCEQVDTALSASKDICTTLFKKEIHKKGYIQPKNITFRKLRANDHSTLMFSWPDSVKIIFFNLEIQTNSKIL